MQEAPSPRPVIHNSRSLWEWSLELLSVVGLFSIAAILYISWPGLPAMVPTHFDLHGIPDRYGSKNSLVFFPMLAGLEYLLLSVVSAAPWRLSYVWSITGENASRQYSVARVMLAELKTLLAWLFVYIAYKEIQVATGQAYGLGLGFLPMTLLIIFALIAVNLRKAYRAR